MFYGLLSLTPLKGASSKGSSRESGRIEVKINAYINGNNSTFVLLIKTPSEPGNAHRKRDISFVVYTLKSTRSLNLGPENTQGPNQ